jgi:hypothetical protein
MGTVRSLTHLRRAQSENGVHWRQASQRERGMKIINLMGQEKNWHLSFLALLLLASDVFAGGPSN